MRSFSSKPITYKLDVLYMYLLLLLSRFTVSDSVWPRRWQPTRLPHPWDSPGKNTRVGCHFLLQCMKVKVKVKLLSHVWLFLTPWTAAYQAPPSVGFSRQEYWSGVPLPSLCMCVCVCINEPITYKLDVYIYNTHTHIYMYTHIYKHILSLCFIYCAAANIRRAFLRVYASYHSLYLMAYSWWGSYLDSSKMLFKQISLCTQLWYQFLLSVY